MHSTRDRHDQGENVTHDEHLRKKIRREFGCKLQSALGSLSSLVPAPFFNKEVERADTIEERPEK